jgi:hypothetical protein
MLPPGEIVRPIGDVCKHCPIQHALARRVDAASPSARRTRLRSISYARNVSAGGILIVVVMLAALPVAVMLGGAIWSALLGWFLVEDAEAKPAPEQS